MSVKVAAQDTAPVNQTVPAIDAHQESNPFRQSFSLDGEWTFQFGNGSPQSIQVPAPWESQRPDLINMAGAAVYERTFSVPDSFNGSAIWIRFGAVDYFCEVWINGIFVGAHEGGYTPFRFRIDKALHRLGADVQHTVLVRVTDATVDQDTVLPDGRPLIFADVPHGKQSWYASVGGLWQSVTIESTPQVHLAQTMVSSSVDGKGLVIHLEVSGFDGQPDAGWGARISVETESGPLSLVLRIDSECERREGLAVLTGSLEIPEPQLWSPEHPHLYRVLITLECDGEVMDALQCRSGIRTIETREGRVLLNGKVVFLIGALDQDFHPRTIYTATSREQLRDQFVKARAMGLNLIRCHIKVPCPEYLEMCDEIGLMVWYELPNGARLSTAFRERAHATIADMWRRDACHPCICILSIMNESWGIDLNNGEQRKWLAQTYRWAKRSFPNWLVVDNSACLPNFHVVSDLDDYHVYFNIPDQAEDFSEWVTAFAGREAGTFTGYGDAESQRSEPLLISEFGNWGLPDVSGIIEAEGKEPYWFKTGDGATRPNRVLERFESQKLDRVYKDYTDLARSSQEQEWLSLKWEIEEMRRHEQVAGYVITEFTDVNWECNGLLDMARNPKVFYSRLADVQAQDILIPRLSPRWAFWEHETGVLSVELSCFTGRPVAGGTLHWEIEGVPGQSGETPVRLAPHHDSEPAYGCYPVAQVWITAPPVLKPTKTQIRLRLTDARGDTVAVSNQNIVFVPSSRRVLGAGKSVWLYDPLHSAIGLSSLLTGIGCTVVNRPEPNALGLVTRWDPAVSNFLHSGGRAVLVAAHARSVTIASGLGVRLLERNTNGWWGDWCTSKIWFVPDHFPSLPDTDRFDFEYQSIIPERVLTGPLAENISAGIFVGWLHNPAAIVARLPIGKGDLIVTTFNLLPSIGSDPIATLLLQDLFALPPAQRSE